jgi:hypothetical protein
MPNKMTVLLCAFVFVLGVINSSGDDYTYQCGYDDTYYDPGTDFQAGPCTNGHCKSDGDIDFTTTCCYYKNTKYDLEASFIVPCGTGYCYANGSVSVRYNSCQIPNCRKPVLADGACCKTCPPGSEPTCYYNGTTYDVGPIPNYKPCYSCNCTANNGQIACVSGSCPVLRCPAGQQPTLKAGDCCKKCTAA